MSIAKELESFYRSQGWSGTHWDSPRDDGDIYDTGSAARTNYLSDKFKEAAGDDGNLSYDEYVSAILNNRPDKYAYLRDTTSNALARFASSSGVTIDDEALKQNNLVYEGKDIIQRLDAGDLGPNRAYADSVKHMGSFDEGDDEGFTFWRWSGADTSKEEEEDPVDPVDPVEDCPDGQKRGLSGKCIDDKKYADNPWEEPEKTPRELKDKREDWDANWDPTRKVNDPSELGSIPYWTPTMTAISGSSSKYKPSITEGKFHRYITGDDYDHSKEQIESVLRASGYKNNRSY
tara:strand:+ start:1374 stop:2243 length:870 start_codon:yes stop_codon:yes gene_type:complete